MPTNTNNARQSHVSPGIYTKETEINYAARSLGITTMGLVGETVKGPAFQRMLITNWREYQTYFGGTNPEVFKGTNYLKYEAPYIAKSYLEQSQQLYMTRVLGLSGVNAGPAWAITAYAPGDKSGANMLVCILRSRGYYQKTAYVEPANPEEGICEDVYEYDKLKYYVSETSAVSLTASKSLTLGVGCDKVFGVTTDASGTSYFNVSQINYGRFTIKGTTDDGDEFSYAVTFNPSDKNYILNVLGTQQGVGDTYLYVEEMYDVALKQLIERGEITGINQKMVGFEPIRVVPKYEACQEILLQDEQLLTRKDVGKRYLATADSLNPETGKMWNVHKTADSGVTYTVTAATQGNIYEVVSFVTTAGTREYYYNETGEKIGANTPDETNVLSEAVYVESVNMTYAKDGEGVNPLTLDLNNYKEQYRFASTPWIVSELKGDAQNLQLAKLFRFHTISDGDSANVLIKISIERIRPDEGRFNVVIRDFYDTDASPVVYERYSDCDLIPGSSNYIAKQIGSYDGSYVTNSNYVTVEVNENDRTRYSIPAGFLGYPMRDYAGLMPGGRASGTVKQPVLQYNNTIDEDVRSRKQYFGLSNLTGIDEDIVKYKGVEAYNDLPSGLTPCFHLDSRIVTSGDLSSGATDFTQEVSVDGVTGYKWTTVDRNQVTSVGIEPRIGTEEEMSGTIYEDITYRKFTLVPYGGWDGWDYYRQRRSITDDFKYSKYKGYISEAGYGTNFNKIKNPLLYNLDTQTNAITSDWYAYLSAIRTFANPKTIYINVLATPGIDYVNDNLLVQEVVDMVEEERGDCLYVVTTPDKPAGASDSVLEMYNAEDAVANLSESEINSSYVCSYYPNVQYYDQDNNVYIYISPTKDVVRNFALTDNTKFPWFAPAGWERGIVQGVRPKKYLTLDEQDTLYEGRLNFINCFAQDGFRLWGQKTMYDDANSLRNRIAVRRLMLRVKSLISIAAVKLIFDPNDATTLQSFKSLITPILDDVRENRGLADWKLEAQTGEQADPNDSMSIYAKIWLQPIPALEYIDISFILSRDLGAVFNENE